MSTTNQINSFARFVFHGSNADAILLGYGRDEGSDAVGLPTAEGSNFGQRGTARPLYHL
jgi:hypothetical protein